MKSKYRQYNKYLNILLMAVYSFNGCGHNGELKPVLLESNSPFQAELPEITVGHSNESLPTYESPREILLAKQDAFDTRGNFANIYGKTSPPPSLTKAIAEFEATESVLISWDWSDQAYLFRLIQLTASRAKVWVLTNNKAESTRLKSTLVNLGVAEENLGFFEFKHESIWTRDYGPLSIVDEQGIPAIVDVKYYRNRRRDDAIPTLLSRYFSMPVYRPEIEIEGGNFMSDGAGRCFFSSRVLEVNYAKDDRDLSDLFYRYLGCEQSLVLEPLVGEGTGHIDMFSKLVGPNTMLLGYYRSNDDPMNAYLLEQNAQRIRDFATQTNWPLKIIKVPMPRVRLTGAYPSYTNSLIVNDLVIVPIYPRQRSYEAEALYAYQEALGSEYQIATIDADNIIEMGGAVHCTTMGFVTSPNFVEGANPLSAPPQLNRPQQQSTNQTFTSRPNLRIPDLRTIQDQITVSNLGSDQEVLYVTIDITHSFPSDLIIVLSDGLTDIMLLNKERISGNRLQRNFTVELTDDYNPNRVWRLLLSDREQDDEGILNSWSLKFE